MMDQALQQAIDALQIRDVYLRATQALLVDDFEPKYDSNLDAFELQLQHVVTHSSVLELEQEGESAIKLFRVFIRFGTRWLSPAGTAETPEEDRVRAVIEGTMVAEYEMKSDPGADALKEFALRNASYHVWPYWREYLATQCLRMNLPKVMLPAVQFAKMPTQDIANSETKVD